MGVGLVEADVHRHAQRLRRGELQQRLLEQAVAAAQHHQLQRRLPQLLGEAEHEIHAFLLGQPAHHGEQRHVGFPRQSGAGLQRALAGRLALGVRGIVGARQGRVARRVPHRGVDAVEDAGERAAPTGEQALQAHAQRLALDLLGVGRAHGRDGVGVIQARFEKGQLTVILDAVDRPALRRQPDQRQGGRGNMPWKARLWMVVIVGTRVPSKRT